MSNRRVSFDIETRDAEGRPGVYVLMCNPVELGTWVHRLFELTERNPQVADHAYATMHTRSTYGPIEVADHAYAIDYGAIEARIILEVDFNIGDVVATKETMLRAFPHEPHRTYDWRQRLQPRAKRGDKRR